MNIKDAINEALSGKKIWRGGKLVEIIGFSSIVPCEYYGDPDYEFNIIVRVPIDGGMHREKVIEVSLSELIEE